MIEEDITLKYVEVNKMQCFKKEIKVSKRSLETIIEMAIDYSKILLKQSENKEGSSYNEALYIYKSEEVQKIADDLSEKIGYCKACKLSKEIDDVGMGAFEIMGHRNRV